VGIVVAALVASPPLAAVPGLPASGEGVVANGVAGKQPRPKLPSDHRAPREQPGQAARDLIEPARVHGDSSCSPIDGR
jgi:hypothetical protein